MADHTVQCKVTLGGNIGGTIIYREAVLPLLVSDSEFVIAGLHGVRTAPIHEAFDGKLSLARGEFLAQVITALECTKAPHFHAKKTKLAKIDYPLLTLCALRRNGRIRVAVSGVSDRPYRSLKVEDDLNEPLPAHERARKAIEDLPCPALDNLSGSAQYRLHVLGNTLLDVLDQLGG